MLPSAMRLRENRDFRLIYARGRSHAHPVAVLYVMRRLGGHADSAPGLRVGFVVSKKQGGAVVRNRIKRRLREAVRNHLTDLCDKQLDVILVGRSRASGAEWAEVEQAVYELLRRGNLLRDSHSSSSHGETVGTLG